VEKAEPTVEERLKRKHSVAAGVNKEEVIANFESEKRKRKRKDHEGN